MSGLGVLTRTLRNQGDGPPVPMGGRGGIFGRGSGTPAGTGQALDSTSSNGTMFGIVNRLSTAVAQCEWGLYRSNGTGNEDDDEPVTNHLAWQVFNHPNDFMTRQEWFEVGEQHIDLTGEGWSVYGKTGAWPTSIWPVRPDHMKPVTSPTEYLTGYVYTNQGQEVPLAKDDVMFIRMPNPNDNYRGLGPVQALLATIDSMRFGTQWNRNFFINGAEPGGVIKVVKNLTDDEWKEFNQRWADSHRGVSRANTVAVLEGSMEWQGNAMTHKDMQFVQLQSVGRDIIYEAYTMPKTTMGITENANRAVAEAGDLTFNRWLVKPRLDRWKRALNNDFLPLYGATAKNLYFNYKSPISADVEQENATLQAKWSAASSAISSGFFAPDVLAAIGLPEVTFGAPDANPDRQLLIDLVKGAPSLAPIILPMLGFTLPAPVAPAAPPA